MTRAAWWTALEPLLPAAPARIADLGCGTGTVSVLLGEHGHHVTGVDLSPKMIELARIKARSAGQPIQFEVGDVSEPQLALGGYDVVFARHVVWALPDPTAALHRWAGLLAPGGRFVLVEGHWGTGAGLTAESLRALVAPVTVHISVVPLTDAALWGKKLDDERYALLAQP